MANISDRMGFGNPAELPKPGHLGHSLSSGSAATPAAPQLVPDGPMGIQSGQQQGGGSESRSSHFSLGASEARPAGDIAGAAGEGAAAGGAEAGLAGAAEELAPLALAAL